MCEQGDAAVRKTLDDFASQAGVDIKMFDGICVGMGLDPNQAVTRKRFKAGERFDACPRHNDATGWTLEKEEVSPSPSSDENKGNREELMMEFPPFPGQVFCSDNECPCPNTKMPPAKGYLWIKPEVAETRRKCPSLSALQGFMMTSGINSIDAVRKNCVPIVVCEQAARRRGLDLAVAASDYDAWVKKGKVPCRPTPLGQRNPAAFAATMPAPPVSCVPGPGTSAPQQQPAAAMTQAAKIRPLSVAIIGWYLIVAGALGLISTTIAIIQYKIHDVMSASLYFQFARMYIGLLITSFAGWAMLKGYGWGRLLYVIWTSTMLLLGLATVPMKAALLPGLAVFGVITVFLFLPGAGNFFSRRRAVPLVDVGSLVFQGKSLAAIGACFKTHLPPQAEMTFSDKKPLNIQVRDGLWHGAFLFFDDAGQQMNLTRIVYFIPSFFAKMIIFAISIVVFSIIVTVICTTLVGEFVPVFFGVGGAAGVGGYAIIKVIILAMIRGSWEGELHQALAKAKG